LLLALQAPVVGVLMGLLFKDTQNRAVPLFMTAIAAIFFSCFNACREIVSERAIFRRERMVNLRIAPYVFSKFILLAGVDLIQVAVMLWIAGEIVGFEGSLTESFAILAVTALASSAMGLALSSIVKSAEAAMAIVPMILIPQIMLAGTIAPLDADWKQVAAAPMVSRWATEALLDVEHRGITAADKKESGMDNSFAAGLLPTRADNFKITSIDQFKLTGGRREMDMELLVFFLALFLGATCWILATRDRVQRR